MSTAEFARNVCVCVYVCMCACACLQVLPASIDYTTYKQPLTTSISSASLKPRGVQFCNAMHFGKMGVSAGSFLNATLQT